ncbi:ABC transporter substrate-binding protein [uncultured Boseongicola sp.]|jgi:ABC-type nitrate/sulfonate/bicarbonate transport system substrate-binding protein|uniref:ABC transporter substrate-binding protein n=1 Tax=uncultured Boseongicola sp. TaxID=1648499 RepID=UPI00262A52B8|nr:ABC transporter substrate-binding protein [uncultured Boseongicola sp.]
MTLRLNRRHFLGTVGAAAAASALPMRAMAATPMTMQAAWINDAEFAGYFLAMDQGYYADEGLDLTYLSGGPDVIPESTIIAGRADLALTTPDTTIKAIVDQGAPFKIIGAQYQKNPIGIVSLVGSGINSPTDLVGKTLAVPPVNVISVEAMLKLNNIAPSDVNIVPYAYDPTPLIKGEIDASLDFTTNVPYTISQQGAEATSFLLYDFGYTTYNDTVVVTDEILNTKRAELVAWLRASRKGWVENNADTTVWPPKWADTHFAGTGRTIDNEVFFNGAQKPLMENPAGVFAMTEEGIEANLGALAEVGIVGSRDMFDTTLLEEI